MTAWGELNRDALTLAPEDISGGKRLGFLDAVQVSYDEQFRYYSQFGAEYEYRNMEEENVQRIREASGVRVGRLEDNVVLPANRAEVMGGVGSPYGRGGLPPKWKPYTDVMQSLMDTGEMPSLYVEREKQMSELQKRYPDAGILTYSQMYDSIKTSATRARERAAQDTTWAGTAGWFIGSTAGGLDPRVNPINALTLPVGGAGKTILGRVATQAGGQAAAEAFSQLTGARTNQQLLGGSPTVLDTALQVGGAAIGGAAVQGVAEGLGWLGRRWFRQVPDDPAPPAPEPPAPAPKPAVETVATVAQAEQKLAQRMSITIEGEQAVTRAVREGLGKGRSVERASRADFFQMRAALMRFDGPLPWEVQPPTHTRLPQEVQGVQSNRMQPATPGETLDDVARRVDPETFRVYDNVKGRQKQSRDLIEHERNLRDIKADGELKPLVDEIAKQEARLANASARNAKKINAKLAEMRTELEAKTAELKGQDNTSMAIARRGVMSADEKLRELAPAVSRAYSRAQGKWDVQQQTLKDVERMMKEGSTELKITPSPLVENAEKEFFHKPSVTDAAPELRSTIAKPVADGADAVDEVQRVAAEMQKQSDVVLENFRNDIKKLLGEGAENAGSKDKPLELEGFDSKLGMEDTILVTLEDGTGKNMTVREMLESVDESGEVLKAVSTCSVGVTSATA